jgi:2-polyprenyl-3-methyl-5-hydroxy-6-metoxy-1,4-benzoquinol methylase
MNNDAKNIFTDIYNNWSWGSNESRSGPGSTLEDTKNIIDKLPILFNQYGISTVLDASCGDFNWMKRVDLSGVNYTGGDIVDDLIVSNQNLYSKSNINFIKLNVVEDVIPKSDLIILRDTLFHFTNDDIKKTLNNIKKSGSKYLLTTSYQEKEKKSFAGSSVEVNSDIKTGDWRFLNLEISPFNLLDPLYRILELPKWEEHHDKSLGLWDISKIPDYR